VCVCEREKVCERRGSAEPREVKMEGFSCGT
jgi:hypothetical protein